MKQMTRQDIVRRALSEAADKWPSSKLMSESSVRHQLPLATLTAIIDRRVGASKPLEEVLVSVDEAYELGATALSLRAEALRISGTSYSAAYKTLSQQAGLDVLHARVRRRAIYFPVLADDDTLVEIIVERERNGLFPLVRVTDELKSVRSIIANIDWLPFGGMP